MEWRLLVLEAGNYTSIYTKRDEGVYVEITML